MEPLCSVICPTRDRRQYIPHVVAQFLAQTHPQKELIFVNGGEPIGDLIAGIEGVRCIDKRSSETTAAGRIAEALNIGAQTARGEYCFRFDDDDLQAPDRIEKQLALFRLTGKSVVAGSSNLFMVAGSPEVYEYAGEPWGCVGLTHAFRREYALAHPYRATPDACEDMLFARDAYGRGELCSISGADWVIGIDHPSGTTGGRLADPVMREILLSSDSYHQVSAARASAILAHQGNSQKE